MVRDFTLEGDSRMAASHHGAFTRRTMAFALFAIAFLPSAACALLHVRAVAVLGADGLTPVHGGIAVLANWFGPWGVLVVRIADFPNAGLRSFHLPLALGLTVLLAGFLLLDERDEGVLTALLVTPVPLGSYLLYRTTLPLLAGFAVTVAGYPLAGLAPLPLPALLATAAVAALNGPATALFLAAFAENKVTGFALVKIVNTLAMVPIAAWFLRPPWQLAAGLVPTYWPMKMTWQAAAGGSWAVYALPGLAAYGLAIALLLRRFGRRVHA